MIVPDMDMDTEAAKLCRYPATWESITVEASFILALTPLSGHLTRENVHYGKITSGVHS